MGVISNMRQYQDMLGYILANKVIKQDRTGVGTWSVFGYDMRFDLSKGFPLCTTKKLHFKGIAHELLWMIKGYTNVKYLRDNGVTIWDEWADTKGDLGPIYGKQWRNFGGVDQLYKLTKELKTNPDSRRLIISAWNPGELDEMVLPPCHCFVQFYVAHGKLSCKLTQRSADAFLGVPYNIASYSLLTHMLAATSGYKVGEFIWSGGDCHIYTNHMTQVHTQLLRTPHDLPRLILNPDRKSIFEYLYDDLQLIGYNSYPAIKAEVAV